MEGFLLLFHKDFFLLLFIILFICVFCLSIWNDYFQMKLILKVNFVCHIWKWVQSCFCGWKDALSLGQLENTDCAFLLLSSLFPHPLISFWVCWILMFDSCLLQNTAAKWWGSSVISDKLRMSFSPRFNCWGLLGHVQLSPSNAR